MRDILNTINKIEGVRGSMVLGEDGLPIASNLADGADSIRLGARASAIGSALRSSLTKLDRGNFKRYTIGGSSGSAIILDLGKGNLVLVLLRRDINMGLVLVELDTAAKALTERIQL